ncbi:LysR family transcriptional regulator [Nocardia sp. NPDC004711]
MQILPTGLVYFREVARAGSMSEAATTLTVAQSAISRQIAKLESTIGVPLFERHPRGMTLTDAGTRLLAHVLRSEAESTTLVDDLRAGRGLHTRTITVASSEAFGRQLLPRAIATFRRDEPDVAFQLDIVGNEEATRRVLDGAADVAVATTTRPQHGVRVEGAAVVAMYAIVPLGHELAEREHVGLAELCKYPLAMPPAEGTTIRSLIDVGMQIENTTYRPVLWCDGHTSNYEFVRQGGGVAVIGVVGDPTPEEGIAYIKLGGAVVRNRQAQVQTMAGRMLPLPMIRFTTLLVSLLQ